MHYPLGMSIDFFAAPDSLELLAMFESASALAQAQWEEQETLEEAFESACNAAKAEEFFSNLAK
jgi:hypothetical protein